MKKTKVFKSGNSLAVRLPKDYQINSKEVYITKRDNKLIIFPVKEKWDILFDLLEELENTETKNFLKGREQPKPQEREIF